MAKIIDVEGIGPKYADKLVKVGVKTTGALLKAGATTKGREDLAEKTDISDALGGVAVVLLPPPPPEHAVRTKINARMSDAVPILLFMIPSIKLINQVTCHHASL